MNQQPRIQTRQPYLGANSGRIRYPKHGGIRRGETCRQAIHRRTIRGGDLITKSKLGTTGTRTRGRGKGGGWWRYARVPDGDESAVSPLSCLYRSPMMAERASERECEIPSASSASDPPCSYTAAFRVASSPEPVPAPRRMTCNAPSDWTIPPRCD